MNEVKIARRNTNTNSVWAEIFAIAEKKYGYLIGGPRRRGEKYGKVNEGSNFETTFKK